MGGWPRLCSLEDTAERSPLRFSLDGSQFPASPLRWPRPWFPASCVFFVHSFVLVGACPPLCSLGEDGGYVDRRFRALDSLRVLGWLPAGAASQGFPQCLQSDLRWGKHLMFSQAPSPLSPGSCPLPHFPRPQPLWASAEHKFAAGLGQGVWATAISPVVAPHHLSFQVCHFLILGGFIS